MLAPRSEIVTALSVSIIQAWCKLKVMHWGVGGGVINLPNLIQLLSSSPLTQLKVFAGIPHSSVFD